MIEPAIGQVWQTLSGVKFILRAEHLEDPKLHVEWTYVCERAHEDEDYS